MFPVSEFNIFLMMSSMMMRSSNFLEKFSVNPHSFGTNWFFHQTQKRVRLVSGVFVNINAATTAFTISFFGLW
jgi:hypothetical protein